MALIPPSPVGAPFTSYTWADWYEKVRRAINDANTINWSQITFDSGTPLPIVLGGTGTATPALVAGTNVTITGLWPNNTINATATVTPGTYVQIAGDTMTGNLVINKASGSQQLDLKAVSTQNSEVRIAGDGNTVGTTSLDVIQAPAGAYVYNRANTPLIFGTNNNEVGAFDVNGWLGIGGRPASGWASGSSVFRGVQFAIGNYSGAIWGQFNVNALYMGTNVYYDGAYKYVNATTAALCRQYDDGTEAWIWSTAAAGAANAAVTFVDRMKLKHNGALQLTAYTAGALVSDASGNVTVSTAVGTKTYCVFTPNNFQPVAANYATFDTRNSRACYVFDDTTDESLLMTGKMPEGAITTSGLKVIIEFKGATATSGNMVWGAAFERGTTDSDSDSFDTETTATAAVNGTSGISTVVTLTCTTIDSIVAGDHFILKIARKASNGSDTATGYGQLFTVEVQQV